MALVLPSTPAYAGLTSAQSLLPGACALYPHIRGADLLTCGVSRFWVAVGSLPRWWLPGEP